MFDIFAFTFVSIERVNLGIFEHFQAELLKKKHNNDIEQDESTDGGNCNLQDIGVLQCVRRSAAKVVGPHHQHAFSVIPSRLTAVYVTGSHDFISHRHQPRLQPSIHTVTGYWVILNIELAPKSDGMGFWQNRQQIIFQDDFLQFRIIQQRIPHFGFNLSNTRIADVYALQLSSIVSVIHSIQ